MDTQALRNDGTDCPMKYVPKGWGSETWVCNNAEYCGKILYMNAGCHLSFHYHLLKLETFWIAKGKIRLVYGDSDDMTQAKEIILEQGMNFHVYRGLRHRLYALEDSEVIEFSTTHYDEDSVRLIPGD
jgi:quercetin dioxygenase-like cupin family protein